MSGVSKSGNEVTELKKKNLFMKQVTINYSPR